MLGQTEGGFNPNVTIKPVGFKSSVGPEEIREIVNRLNQKPFEEKLTLVSFDELNTLEFLELLNKVLAYLEPKHNVNIREETQEQTAVRVTEFLKVLNYPSNFDMNFQQNLVQADRRTVYPILYYILTRLPEHQKRAYLAKFLVPIQVPEEFLGDDEMKNTFNQYKDLQAEFQVIHQALDNVQKDSMNPADLKKEITQLEQEREQLNSKINSFKTKNQNKPEFQALLEATNLLRKEQEEEARIADKLRQQRDQLEYTDQLLLSAQQRLIEARKSMAPENTPEQMLQGLRNEVKKNRDMANERLAMEIGEKFKKIEALENILREPTPTTADMNMMENKVLQLRQQIGNLEEKLSKNAGNPADDKLAIYKQQAALVTKKKEKVFEDLKKAEEERNRLENDVAKKEQDLQKLKGPGYKSKDEFKQYAANLREKTNKFKKLKEELKEFRNEYAVLTRTEGIIQNRKSHYEQILKKEENRLGIVGAVETHEKLQEVSEQKGIIDEKKGQTLEEISKIVISLESQLKAKRKHLEPKIKELKEYREKFGEIEKDYKQKKADYEHVLASTESEITALEAEAKKVRDDVYRDDTRISILDYQSQVLDLMFQRMNQEAEFNAGSKKLSNEAKSYKDFFENKITQQDAEVKDLRKQREAVKETYEPAQKQFAMFNDLKLLMNAKMRSMGSGGTGGGRNNEEAFGNVNRLVVRE